MIDFNCYSSWMSFKSFQCFPFRCLRSDHGDLWYWWGHVTICPRISRDLEWPNHVDVRWEMRQMGQMGQMGQESWPLKDGSEIASWRSRSANVLTVFVESVISCFSLSLLVGAILVGGWVCDQKLLCRNLFSWQKLMSKHPASLQKMMRDHDHQLEAQRNLQWNSQLFQSLLP